VNKGKKREREREIEVPVTELHLTLNSFQNITNVGKKNYFHILTLDKQIEL
jgi:hypothetical protein